MMSTIPIVVATFIRSAEVKIGRVLEGFLRQKGQPWLEGHLPKLDILVFEPCGLSLDGHHDGRRPDWDGFLWNTPKKRKSLERRNTEKFGSLEWGTLKILRPNKRIRVDHRTGEFFELGKLAKKTYEKVMAESKAINRKISDTFGQFSPRDKEVRLYYEGERDLNQQATREDENRLLVVEMEKQRPKFFSRNLTEKARVPSTSSSNTTVRPTGLG